MTKIVQLAGGTAETQDFYIGPERELTVDTSNYDLRLHDGVTPGGRVIMQVQNADARYQARSVELDGLLEFEPQQRGYLVRLGPSDYVLRRIVGQAGHLVVINPDAYDANTVLSLPETVTPDLTFAGEVTFSQRIVAAEGIAGDSYGLHHGNVDGDVLGNVTGNLFGNAAGNHTGSFKGDVNVSDHNIFFANNQIPTAAINGLLAFVQAAGVPTGAILMWSGSISTIPAGWFLCDGSNGTPDLRGLFIRGAGGALVPGDAGGAPTHIHSGAAAAAGTHVHGITVNGQSLSIAQLPQHRHGTGLGLDGGQNSATALYGTFALPGPHPTSISTDTGDGVNDSYTSYTGSGDPHNHSASSDAQGDHIHSLLVDAASSLPPFYALAYIMKG